MVELDDRVVGPELGADLLAADHLPGTLHQHFQNLEGLLRQADALAVPNQFPCPKVQLERAKARCIGGQLRHGEAGRAIGIQFTKADHRKITQKSSLRHGWQFRARRKYLEEGRL
jgi:hypothetical protein